MGDNGNPLLEVFYYASYLIPVAFLSLGLQFFSVPKHWSEGRFLTLLASTAAMLSVVWWGRGLRLLVQLGSFRFLALLALVMIGVLILRTIWAGSTATLIGALLAVSMLELTCRAPEAPLFQFGPRQIEDAFQRITESIQYCEKVREGRDIRFWIDRKDVNQPEFASIASGYLYGFALLSLDFPALPSTPPPADTLIVIPSSSPNALRLAQGSLKAAGLNGKALEAKW